MKQSFIIILAIFVYLTGFAQRQIDTLTLNNLQSLGFQISNSISDFPKDEFPKNTNKVFIATRDTNNSYDISLIFMTDDSRYIQTSFLEIKEELDYKCQRPYVTYSNGFIKLECRWMKGIVFATKLRLDSGQISFIENYLYDVNEDVHSKAEMARKKDDPIAYCEAYMGAQYYSDLEYRVKESLEWAHKKALQYYKMKNYQSAASIMLELEQRCAMSTEIHELMGNNFINIWSDVTLFYLKANMNEACVQLSQRLIEIAPELAGIYLQYGDALFNMKQTEEYKKIYHRYIELMTQKDKISKIPSRVYERIK